MRPRLRLYTGEEDGGVATAAPPEVSVRFGEILDIVSDALRCDRAWLSDFGDDEVRVPADLYEVLSSYWHLRPSA